MERKHFLKNGLTALGLVAVAPLIKACKKTDTSSDGSTGGGGTSTCTVIPTETEGPHKNSAKEFRGLYGLD